MIKRLFWILFLLLLPVCASALGFGELVVSSYLDQPLRARVELVAGEGLQAEDIRASLAAAETFNKAGVDRPFSLSKLRFKTVVTESGRAYIDITSRETIREPYLDFLVEVAWGGATLVKEFTILLDPPVYEPVAAAVPPAKSVAGSSREGASCASARGQLWAGEELGDAVGDRPKNPSAYGLFDRTDDDGAAAGEPRCFPPRQRQSAEAGRRTEDTRAGVYRATVTA